MDTGLKALGRTLREAQHATLPVLDMAAQKQRFLAQASKTSRPSPRSFAPAVLAAAALALVWVVHPPTRVSFEIAGAAGRERQWIVAPASGSLELAFSEGSRVRLFDRARARVVDTTSQGARVVLERGSLQADVMHRAGTRWRVDAGPFAVHVVGTRFQVSWDAARERFQLALEEGSVRVVGPSLGQGRLLVAGQRLELALGKPLTETRQAPDVGRPAQEPTKSLDVEPLRKPPTAAPVGRATAMDRAEELWNAADVARLSRQPAQAAAALRELRRRYPEHPRAHAAAFMLGRLAFDQLGAPDAAARWFAVYLGEAPRGMFATEALGRLIECQLRLQDGPAAQRSARRYLARHPHGPHAQLARDLTGVR